LVVDPDAVFSSSVAAQCFQSIAGGNAQILEARGNVQLAKLAPGYPFEGLKGGDRPSLR